MKEVWKQYKNTRYSISNQGRVRNDITGLILEPNINRYAQVVIYLDTGPKTQKIHRMVAETYLVNIDNKPQVNHKNGNKIDNRVENLEWCTQSENQLHAFETGLQESKKGVDHHNARLSEDAVLTIKGLLELRIYSGPEIANMFGVQQQLISKINKGRRWSHLTGWTPENRAHITVNYGKFISKLSSEDIPIIRQMIKENKSDGDIADIFKVHKGTINSIRNGKTWKNY